MLARDRNDAKLEQLAELCRAAGVRVSIEPRDHLTRLAQDRRAPGARGTLAASVVS